MLLELGADVASLLEDPSVLLGQALTFECGPVVFLDVALKRFFILLHNMLRMGKNVPLLA